MRRVFVMLVVATSVNAQQSVVQSAVGSLQNYLNMAGDNVAKNFRPLSQRERNNLYRKGLTNPWSFLKAGMSSGIDHLHNKPEEWGQGFGPYAERFANIEGQYIVQKTITYIIASPLHEDNRYFGSGKRGFWPRTRYALSSSLLARHDSGRHYLSFSQVGGVAAGAFVARLWLPGSENTAGDAAVSFGISMGGNIVTSELKEFLPDLLRKLGRRSDGGSIQGH